MWLRAGPCWSAVEGSMACWVLSPRTDVRAAEAGRGPGHVHIRAAWLSLRWADGRVGAARWIRHVMRCVRKVKASAPCGRQVKVETAARQYLARPGWPWLLPCGEKKIAGRSDPAAHSRGARPARASPRFHSTRPPRPLLTAGPHHHDPSWHRPHPRHRHAHPSGRRRRLHPFHTPLCFEQPSTPRCHSRKASLATLLAMGRRLQLQLQPQLQSRPQLCHFHAHRRLFH